MRECKKVQQCLLCKPGGNKTKQNQPSNFCSEGQGGEGASLFPNSQPTSGNSHSHTVILSTSRELALDRIRHFMMVHDGFVSFVCLPRHFLWLVS